MTIPLRLRSGCSPWSLMGCGCGLLAGIGIMLVFFSMGILKIHEDRDPTWKRQDYAQCQDNLRYLRAAIASYERDYHHLPARLDDLSPQYVDNIERLRCPLEKLELGTHYRYTPNAVLPTDPLITCTNHGHGPIVLRRNGIISLPTLFSRK